MNFSQKSFELLQSIQSEIKFFTESDDGTFALETKSIEELKTILSKSEQ